MSSLETECNASKSCLSQILEFSNALDYKSFAKQLLVHLLREEQDVQSIKVEESMNQNSSNSIPGLPTVQYLGMEKPHCDYCLYICDHSCWLRIRHVIQLLSGVQFRFGEASYEVSVTGYQTLFVWSLIANSDKLNVDTIIASRKVWFQVHRTFSGIFQRLLQTKFHLYIQCTFCHDANTSEKDETLTDLMPKSQNGTVILHLVHHNEEELSLLSQIRSDNIHSNDAIRRLNAHVRFSADIFVDSGWFRGPADLNQHNTSSFNIVVEPSTFGDDPRSISQQDTIATAEVEVQNMDFSHIKSEEIITELHSSVVKGKDMVNGFLQPQENEYSSFIAFLEEYTATCEFNGFSPLEVKRLIVQCPGCCMEYKGKNDQLLQLVKHVVTDHHKDSSSLIGIIQQEYSILINRMRGILQML